MESRLRTTISTHLALTAGAALLGAVALLGPTGCTGTDGAPATVQTASAAPAPNIGELKQRARELWKARADEDWPTVFRLEIAPNQPGVEIEKYLEWAPENEPFIVTEFEVLDAVADGDFGWIELKTLLGMRKFPKMPPRPSQRWQKWHRVNDQWVPVASDQTDSFPAPPQTRDADAEKALRARFDEAWQIRLKQDWEALYLMVDPRDRADSGKPKELPIKYISHDVMWVEAIGDRGRVQAAYLHRLDDPSLTKMPPQNLITTEMWIRIDGTWYLDVSAGDE